MQTVRELLARAGTDSESIYLLDAQLLLAQCLDKPRSWLYGWHDEPVGGEVAALFIAQLDKRRAGMPLAYLLGSQEFWSLNMLVNRHTLVPRPDTELLVQWALELSLPGNARAADLGTGCGAIALALASERAGWSLTATDVSLEALAVARANACNWGFQTIEFVHSDWFAELPQSVFDLIMSNPPYIVDDDPHLSGDGVCHEPRLALTSGTDGLDAIRAILAGAVAHLVQAGWLLLEHGFEQGEAVRRLLLDHGFTGVTTRRDLAGNERASGGCLSDQ